MEKIKTTPIKWNEYCPGMRQLKTVHDILRDRVQREDEYRHRDVPPQDIPQMEEKPIIITKAGIYSLIKKILP